MAHSHISIDSGSRHEHIVPSYPIHSTYPSHCTLCMPSPFLCPFHACFMLPLSWFAVSYVVCSCFLVLVCTCIRHSHAKVLHDLRTYGKVQLYSSHPAVEEGMKHTRTYHISIDKVQYGPCRSERDRYRDRDRFTVRATVPYHLSTFHATVSTVLFPSFSLRSVSIGAADLEAAFKAWRTANERIGLPEPQI